MTKFTVAVDGPAAAGKGTVARAIAERFGFRHLETGLLYRAVGLKLLSSGALSEAESLAPAIARELDETELDSEGLRADEISLAASRVAAIVAVRDALKDFQRRFAARDGGAVLDGRDIGTVIYPGADAKLFVTAAEEVRAERRYTELLQRGNAVRKANVLAALRARDALDSGRDVAPLLRAKDAVVLDTSDMSIDIAVANAIAIVESKFPQGR